MTHNNDLWRQALEKRPASYDEWFAAEREYLTEHVASGAQTLEVGCGDGRSVADLLPITTNVTAIDYDASAVRALKKRFAAYPSIQAICANATALPFRAEQFDTVLCLTTFANFATKKYDALAEMRRTLKPDGSLILSVFAQNAYGDRMQLYRAMKAPISEIQGTTIVFDSKPEPVISEQFRRDELESILDKAGYRIDNMQQVSIAHLLTARKRN